MYNMELENRQKLWRWLILAAIGVLIVETWLAGRRCRAPFGSCGGIGAHEYVMFQALERVARRFRHERLFSSLAICWLVWALVGCGMKTAWFQEALGSIWRLVAAGVARGSGSGLGRSLRALAPSTSARSALGGPPHRGQASRAEDRAPGRGRGNWRPLRRVGSAFCSTAVVREVARPPPQRRLE